jgi:hypothetical protein
MVEEKEEDKCTLALTPSPEPTRAAWVHFDFPLLFFELEGPVLAGDTPPHTHAFLTCPSSHLQEIPHCLKTIWQAATRVIAKGALNCLAKDDTAGYNAHIHLFIKLPARMLALPFDCQGATQIKLQHNQLLQVVAGVIPAIPDKPATANSNPGMFHTTPIEVICSQGPTRAPRGSRPPMHMPSSAHSRQAKHLIKQGLSSRALQALKQGEPAPVSAETLDQLQALHPPNPTNHKGEQWPKPPAKGLVPKAKAKHLA